MKHELSEEKLMRVTLQCLSTILRIHRHQKRYSVCCVGLKYYSLQNKKTLVCFYLILEWRLTFVAHQRSSRAQVVSWQGRTSTVVVVVWMMMVMVTSGSAATDIFIRVGFDRAEIICRSELVPEQMGKLFGLWHDGIANISTHVFQTLNFFSHFLCRFLLETAFF